MFIKSLLGLKYLKNHYKITFYRMSKEIFQDVTRNVSQFSRIVVLVNLSQNFLIATLHI